jgi:hypothetical protein
MRARHIIAIETVILIGLGVKVFFFSSPTADAHAVKSSSMDISKIQANADLPMQTIQDMTFVFPHAD